MLLLKVGDSTMRTVWAQKFWVQRLAPQKETLGRQFPGNVPHQRSCFKGKGGLKQVASLLQPPSSLHGQWVLGEGVPGRRAHLHLLAQPLLLRCSNMTMPQHTTRRLQLQS